MKIQAFSIKGVKTGEITLPKEFNQEVNLKVLAQAIHVYEERSHVGLRKTKTRSEVNRTTKKVYKQKGTGGARHGSRRANLFVGGGVVFGPRPVRRILNLSNKIKTRAKFIAYAQKVKDAQMVAIEGIQKIEKTKIAYGFIKSLERLIKAKRFTFVLSDNSKEVVKFLRNLAQVKVVLYRDANAFDIYGGGMIVMDEEIFRAKSEEGKLKTERVVEVRKEAKKTVKKIVKKIKSSK